MITQRMPVILRFYNINDINDKQLNFLHEITNISCIRIIINNQQTVSTVSFISFHQNGVN